MIGGLKPYPGYKDSGVTWLGHVPEDWEVLPNRALFIEVKDREHPDEEMLSVTITKGIVHQKTLLAESAKKDSSNLDRSAYKLVQPNDVAYNKMRAWQGAIGASSHRGIVSPAYVIMRPREASSATYFHQLLRTPMFADEAGRWSYGITSDMWSLRPEHFKMIYSVIPPLEEQASIVRFLDHFDRKVTRYIRTKQKLIKVLEEMRQAIIYRTITRGLDPHVPRKPTKIEWLPTIPAHWSIRKLGQLGKVFNGTTPSRMQAAYWADGTIPWLSSGKVNDYIISTASELITDRAYKECSVSLVPRGSVVLGLVGQGKTRGMSALLDIDACINQNLAAIVPGKDIDGRYLHHFLTAFYKTVRELGRGGNQEALNCNIVSKMRVPLPPLNEQLGMCDAIKADCDRVNTVLARMIREIALVRELRTTLMSDVVTGKLDVREAATLLPEEVVETESLDEIEDVPQDESAADDPELEAAE